MTALANPIAVAVMDLLAKENGALPLPGVVELLAEHPDHEVRRLTNDLYMQGHIHRLTVHTPQERFHVFYSRHTRISNGRNAAVDQPAPDAPLSPAQAVAVLVRGGWEAEPEETITDAPAPTRAIIQVERRQADRRQLAPLEVIKRWRLEYPLARIVELIAETRRRPLTLPEANLAVKMIREHLKGDDE